MRSVTVAYAGGRVDGVDPESTGVSMVAALCCCMCSGVAFARITGNVGVLIGDAAMAVTSASGCPGGRPRDCAFAVCLLLCHDHHNWPSQIWPRAGGQVKLLHVVATPRGEQSSTLRVSAAFVESLRAQHADMTVDVVDLYNHDLPAVAGDNIKAKYTLMIGQPIDRNHVESWSQIESLIEHFLSADAYLISTPMWNLSIPYALKYYIDCIIQPGYVFRYDEIGQVVPLVHGKRMICVTSRGGDYAPASPMHAYDFQEPYLRAIFGFIGITDVEFINAEPMDIAPDMREAAVSVAIEAARNLATRRVGVA